MDTTLNTRRIRRGREHQAGAQGLSGTSGARAGSGAARGRTSQSAEHHGRVQATRVATRQTVERDAMKADAAILAARGLSHRAIAPLLGVAHTTVGLWLR